MKNKILIFSLCSLFLASLISCTSTGPQTGSLSGTINLEGQVDHSGIVIGIYEPADLDPDIVEANTNWPHIGVIINQHTEFDHRFAALVKTGETDASGYFEINDIPTGVYNAVAIKDGFGFRYVYEISISEGNNEISNAKFSILNSQLENETKTIKNNSKLKIKNSTLDSKNDTSKADLTLFPETIISEDITEATTFESHHHYIIDQDIIVDDELTIEPGAIIRLNEGREITSYGTFNAVGEYENFIWFTKNDGFMEDLNTIEPDSNYIWDRVTLEPYSQAHVQWCKFDWANIGLLNHVNGFEISDCIFKESNCGFKAEDVDSCFCSNMLCEGIDNEEQGGIYFVNIKKGFICNIIFASNQLSIKLKDNCMEKIYNNFFCNNTISLHLYDFGGLIMHNEFLNNNIDILYTGGLTYNTKSFYVTKCEFFSNTIFYQDMDYYYGHNIYLHVINNNFFKITSSFIHISPFPEWYYADDISYFVESNFFDSLTEIEEIQKLIDIGEDDPINIILENINFFCTDAGIQGE